MYLIHFIQRTHNNNNSTPKIVKLNRKIHEDNTYFWNLLAAKRTIDDP